MAHVQAGHNALKTNGTDIGRELTDRQLLTRYVGQRDEAAFDGLLQRHGQTVWRVCRRVLRQEQDAEDAFQAVFLVLARNAASIRNSDAIGSWLHGVAFRTAMTARRVALRRQAGERGAAAPNPEPPPPSQAACLELQRQLDEELQRLPGIYRAPFVLCCLEGMSKAEAARELGCKEGTVSGRLSRARKILQKRLARRGITLAGVLTALALVPNTGAAAIPAALLQTTAGAVLAMEAGGGISPSVRALADDVLREPPLPRKLLGVLVFASLFLLLGGAALTVSFLQWRGEPTTTSIDPAKTIEPDTFVGPGVGLGTPVDDQVAAVAFSPDGRRLVTAGGKSQRPGRIKIWNAANGHELTAVQKIPGVRALAFSPAGKAFAAGDASGAVILRDAETADELASVQAHPGGVQGVAFSSDGVLLASGGADGMVRLWSGDSLKQVREWRGHTDKIAAVAFFHDSRAIATASEDKSAKIWDAKTGAVKVTLEGHEAALEAVAVSPDDRLVATAGRDGTVRLWDATTGAVRHGFPFEPEVNDDGPEKTASSRPSPSPLPSFHAVAFSPDSTALAAAGSDGVVRLWDTTTFEPVGTVKKHAAPVWALAFSPNWVLASGSADRTVKLSRLRGKNPSTDLSMGWSGIKPILAAAYAPDGAVLAAATTDNIHIRDAQSGDVLTVLRGHTDQVTCLAFSDDGKTLASGSKDRTVMLWERTTGAVQQTLSGHTEAVQTLTFIAEGARLASADAGGTIRFWDVAGGKELAVLQAHEGPIAALACAAEGRILASGGDRTIKFWDLQSGEARPADHAPLTTDAAIRALAFSASGMLASAGDDGLIRLWNPLTPSPLPPGERGRGEGPTATLTGHVGPVRALAFTPKGRTLVSGGQDQSVRVWDGATGAALGVLAGHNDIVTALAIHPQGYNLVSGSLDTRLLRWKAAVMRRGDVGSRKEPRPPVVALQGAPPQQPAPPADKDKAAEVPKEAPKNEPAKAEEPQRQGDFYEDFRGARPPSRVFRMMGIDAGATMTPEADGLRITIPAEQARRIRVRIEMKTSVKGNFEITAGYQILAADQPDEGNGVGFEIHVDAATPTQDKLGLLRLNRPREGECYNLSRGTTENGKTQYKNICTPATARSGQLKLTRRGTEVTAWAAEGAGPFQQLQQTELGAADVNKPWFGAYVGNTEYGVDLRIVDVKIRSELPDDDSAIVPVVAAVADTPPSVSAPMQGSGRAPLMLLGLLLLTVAATLLVAVGIAVAPPPVPVRPS